MVKKMSLLSENRSNKVNSNSESYVMDERNLRKVRDNKIKIPKIKPNITSILPIIDITSNGYFELSNNNGLLEIVQLGSKDIYSVDESEREDDVHSLSYFYQAYPYDLKIVPMNFPVNNETQKEYFRRLISKCKVESYMPHLEEKLRELEELESNKTNREYYLFVYADTEHSMKERITLIRNLLARSNPIEKLTDDKKIKILNKMYNMNTKIHM